MQQTTVRGIHLHYDIEVIPLTGSSNVSHTSTYYKLLMQKTRRCFLLCHQNHSVLTYMYMVCITFVIMLTPKYLSVYTVKGVVRITCEYLLTCIQFQVLF